MTDLSKQTIERLLQSARRELWNMDEYALNFPTLRDDKRFKSKYATLDAAIAEAEQVIGGGKQ